MNEHARLRELAEKTQVYQGCDSVHRELGAGVLDLLAELDRLKQHAEQHATAAQVALGDLAAVRQLLGEAIAAIERLATYHHGAHTRNWRLEQCDSPRCQEWAKLLARLREGVQA